MRFACAWIRTKDSVRNRLKSHCEKVSDEAIQSNAAQIMDFRALRRQWIARNDGLYEFLDGFLEILDGAGIEPAAFSV